jgi:hypothetical protein
MDEQSLAKLLLALSSDDADRWEHTEGKTAPGPSCPPLPRLRNAVLREDWTDAELRHKASCGHCRHTERLVLAGVWHPSPAQLYHQPQAGGNDADAAHHLCRDRCRRCERLTATLRVDPLLSRLARRGGPDRAALERVLRTGLAAREPLAARRVTFDDRHLSVAISGDKRPEFYLERSAAAKGDTRLLYALLGTGPGSQRHLLLPRPVPASRSQVAKLRLDAPPPERAPLVLFEIEPELLSADEAPLLTAALRQSEAHDPAALPVWREWAARALGRKDLDATIRDLLAKVQREGPSLRPR